MKKIAIAVFYLLAWGNLFCHGQDSFSNNGQDWMVKVVLANGSDVKGVVLSNRFIEKAKYGRIYEDSEDFRTPGSGIRLWYVRNNPGYVFLPYKYVDRVVRLEKLTAKERETIEKRIRQKIQQTKIASEETRKRREKLLKKARIGITESEEKELLKKEADELRQQAKDKLNKAELLKNLPPQAAKLITDYPPEQGWGEEIYQKLKARLNHSATKFVVRTITGPDGSSRKVIQRGPPRGGVSLYEQTFVDSYDQWNMAVNMLKQQEKLAIDRMAEEMQKELDKKRQKEESKKGTEPKASPETEVAKSGEKKDSPKTTEAKTAEQSQIPKQSKNQSVPEKSPELVVDQAIEDLLYGNSQAKLKAIDSLLPLGEKAARAMTVLKQALKDSDPKVRATALQAIAHIGHPKEQALEILADTLELGDVMMRREAAAAFMTLGAELAGKKFETLALAVGDEDAKVRYRVIRVMEIIGKKEAINFINKRLWDGDLAVRVAAASALATLIDNPIDLVKWSKEPLIKGLEHPEKPVHQVAAQALKVITIKLANILVQVKNPEEHAKLAKILDDLRTELQKKQPQLDPETQGLVQEILAMFGTSSVGTQPESN